jgi:uncharacterized membrane protein required for colicin V production
MKNLPWGWFDLIVVAVLIFGIVRGRINGMSKEFVPLVQWLGIVIGGALGYKPLAQYIRRVAMLEPFYSNLLAYMTIAFAVFFLVITVKNTIERWMQNKDIFGRLEYFLGMIAGVIRYACIVIFLIALINSREYTSAEIECDRATMKEIYGSEFFPKLYTIQEMVFVNSVSGKTLKKWCPWLLIEPQRPGAEPTRLREWQPY